MIRVLISGLSKEVGGIENLFYSLLKHIDNEIKIHILCFGDSCAYEDEYVSRGISVFHIKTRKENPFLFSRNVKKFFKEHPDYDYVWFNTASTSIYQIQLYAKKICHCKVITHSHGTSFDKNGNTLIYFANKVLNVINKRRVIRNTDFFFCCSLAAGIALFGKEKKDQLVLIKNGIETCNFKFSRERRLAFRKELGIDESSFLVGLFGRLSNQKNPLRALTIFKKVLELRPDCYLIIAGTGELEKSLFQKAKELNILNNIRFLGFRDDVNFLLSAIDCLLMPSFFEGLPLGAIEAQTNGCRCILSDSITDEVKITDLVEFCSLNQPDVVWARKVLSVVSLSVDRKQYYQIVNKLGYSLFETRQFIYDFLKSNK